jgi:hypothetical protein
MVIVGVVIFLLMEYITGVSKNNKNKSIIINNLLDKIDEETFIRLSHLDGAVASIVNDKLKSSDLDDEVKKINITRTNENEFATIYTNIYDMSLDKNVYTVETYLDIVTKNYLKLLKTINQNGLTKNNAILKREIVRDVGYLLAIVNEINRKTTSKEDTIASKRRIIELIALAESYVDRRGKKQ